MGIEKNVILNYSKGYGWSEIPCATSYPINKLYFTDPDVGWISGGYNNNEGFKSEFLRSIDGGETWSLYTQSDYLINDFYFENRDHGWAVGENNMGKGCILETFKGGVDWDVITDTLPSPLHSLHFTDGYGWAVGSSWDSPGLVLKTKYTSTSYTKNIQCATSYLHNYPNPFHFNTVICYELSVPGDVEINLYDLSGRKTAALLKESQTTGRHEIEWNAEGMHSGIYFCELNTRQGRQVIKMILID
jgi:photosystem II stability/assembly factor-like uncharacterized protein